MIFSSQGPHLLHPVPRQSQELPDQRELRDGGGAERLHTEGAPPHSTTEEHATGEAVTTVINRWIVVNVAL